jgi:hypothetical protein
MLLRSRLRGRNSMYMRSLLRVGAVIVGSLWFGGCVGGMDEHGTSSAEDAITSTADPRGGGGGCHQLVWTGTLFFADAAETQLIGECSITCAQWVRGDVELPLPGPGVSCQGTSSGFEAKVIEQCTGCRF